MYYYVNDAKSKITLLVCSSEREAKIFATWANELKDGMLIRTDTHQYPERASGEELLRYFGFTIDSIVDLIFSILPTRSRVDSNATLIKAMLYEPGKTKSACCEQAKKNPTHYSRLSNILGQHCSLIASLTGGRNPMKLLRGLRGDL